MCKVPEELERRLQSFEDGISKATSYSHDAKITSESNSVKVTNIEKLLYTWHKEDRADRKLMWEKINDHATWRAKLIGSMTAAALIASAFVSGIAWAVHYSWGWIVRAFH